MSGAPQWLAKKISNAVASAFGSGMYIVNWRLRRRFGRDIEEIILTEPWTLHWKLSDVHPTYADLVVRIAARVLGEHVRGVPLESAFKDEAAWRRVEAELRRST